MPPLVPGSSTRSVFENHAKSSHHNDVYAKSCNPAKCGRKLISGSSPITRVSYFTRPTTSYNRRYLCFLICLTRKSSKKKNVIVHCCVIGAALSVSRTLVEKNLQKYVSFFSIAIMDIIQNYIIRFNYFGVAILAFFRKKRMPYAV